MQNRPTKFSVLFGVLKKRRYYATKRENEVGKIRTSPWRKNEKALEISVYFALCGVVGNEEKNTYRRVGKKIFSSVEGEKRVAKPFGNVLLAKGAGTAAAIALLVKRTGAGAIRQFLRARFYHSTKIRLSAHFAPAGNLLGSAFPKPCYGGLRR